MSYRFKGGLSVWLDGDRQGEHLAVSSGSMRAGEEDYESGAIVPRSPWSLLTLSAGSRCIVTPQEPIEGRTVRLIEFPLAYLRSFHDLVGGGNEGSWEAVAAAAGTPRGQDLLHDFGDYVSSTHKLGSGNRLPSVLGGFCVKEPNSITVTTDPRSGRRVGLHVDDWYHLPPGTRASAPARLCANFGWQDRFLLFVDISIDDLFHGTVNEFAEWADRHRSEFDKGPTWFARRFLSAFANYPITRLRVRPGEAYIAPTDNLIHDGSSEGGRGIDVACHVHGR